MQPLLLCIHMDPARMMRLSFTALSLGITVKEIKENEWGQPLASLCGIMPMKKNPPSVKVTEEMIVFAFISDALLDQFLLEYKKNRLEPVRLKAVLTEHNQSWSCGQLCAMLRQEAAVLEPSRKGKER